MYGDETLFEKQIRDFEAIEKDPNRNVDEQEEVNTIGVLASKLISGGYVQVDDPELVTKDLALLTDDELDQLEKAVAADDKEKIDLLMVEIDKRIPESKTNEDVVSSEQRRSESQVGKFGVFGYDENDNNVYWKHFDTDTEARGAAVELARELNGKSLAYIEVWQADEEGRFGVSGEPVWKRSFEDELATDESKTNEDVKSDLVDLANARLGWAVAEQLKSILADPTVNGIEEAELNTNAVRMIYQFLNGRTEVEAKEAVKAIEEWVEEGYGDLSVLESKTNKQEEVPEDIEKVVDEGVDKKEITDELEKSLKQGVAHEVRRTGNKELEIATGAAKSIRVKVLGYAKESKEQNE